jgi:threonine dehydrogenase-like Zn-dependent dehydrogenase
MLERLPVALARETASRSTRLSSAASASSASAQEKLKLAELLGANEAVPAGTADDALREISPLGFDVVIDCTGVPAVVEHMFTHVRDNGKLLFFG